MTQVAKRDGPSPFALKGKDLAGGLDPGFESVLCAADLLGGGFPIPDAVSHSCVGRVPDKHERSRHACSRLVATLVQADHGPGIIGMFQLERDHPGLTAIGPDAPGGGLSELYGCEAPWCGQAVGRVIRADAPATGMSSFDRQIDVVMGWNSPFG